MNYFYKAEVSLNQPILFRPSEFLKKFLYMFLSLEDLSAYLANGSYEFMSNTRVGYIIDKKGKDTFTQVKKGTRIKTQQPTNKLNTRNSYLKLDHKGGGRRRSKTRKILGKPSNKKSIIDTYYRGMSSLYKS